jgi:hypothetical protein
MKVLFRKWDTWPSEQSYCCDTRILTTFICITLSLRYLHHANLYHVIFITLIFDTVNLYTVIFTTLIFSTFIFAAESVLW